MSDLEGSPESGPESGWFDDDATGAFGAFEDLRAPRPARWPVPVLVLLIVVTAGVGVALGAFRKTGTPPTPGGRASTAPAARPRALTASEILTAHLHSPAAQRVTAQALAQLPPAAPTPTAPSEAHAAEPDTIELAAVRVPSVDEAEGSDDAEGGDEAQTQPKAQAEPKRQAKAQAEPKQQAKPKAQAEAKRQAKAQAEAKRQAKAQAKAQAEAKRQAKRQAKAQAEAKAKAQAKAQAKAKAQAEAKRPAADVSGLLKGASHKLRSGDTSGAIRDLKRALKLSPGNLKAKYGLGKAYYAAGKDRQAKKLLASVLGASPTHGGALLTMASIALNAGQRAQARKYYQRYLKSHPTGRRAGQVRRALENL